MECEPLARVELTVLDWDADELKETSALRVVLSLCSSDLVQEIVWDAVSLSSSDTLRVREADLDSLRSWEKEPVRFVLLLRNFVLDFDSEPVDVSLNRPEDVLLLVSSAVLETLNDDERLFRDVFETRCLLFVWDAMSAESDSECDELKATCVRVAL